MHPHTTPATPSHTCLHVLSWYCVQDPDDDISDDDNSDDDIDNAAAGLLLSSGSNRHKLQFLIGDNVLPYNMTVYQAVKQYAQINGRDVTDADTDSDNPYGHAGIWVQSHVIWYRPAPDVQTPVASPKKSRAIEKATRHVAKNKDELWIGKRLLN